MSAPIMNTEPVMVPAGEVIRTFGHGAAAEHALRGVSFDTPPGPANGLACGGSAGEVRQDREFFFLASAMEATRAAMAGA